MNSIWHRWRKKRSAVGEEITALARLSFEMSRVDGILWQKALQNAAVCSPQAAAYLTDCLALEYGKEISVDSEIDLLQRYVQLWQSADENMHITFSTQNEGQGLNISPCILFPLLQNALQATYFISEQRPIKCRIRVISNLLTLEISNRVNPYLENQSETELMRWFRARLQYEYPEQHDLIINSNTNLFRATLQLRLVPQAQG